MNDLPINGERNCFLYINLYTRLVLELIESVDESKRYYL